MVTQPDGTLCPCTEGPSAINSSTIDNRTRAALNGSVMDGLFSAFDAGDPLSQFTQVADAGNVMSDGVEGDIPIEADNETTERDKVVHSLLNAAKIVHDAYNSEFAKDVRGGGSAFANKPVGGFVYAIKWRGNISYHFTPPDIVQASGRTGGFPGSTSEKYDVFGNWFGFTKKVAFGVYAPRSYTQPNYSKAPAHLKVDVFVMREDGSVEKYLYR